MDDNIAMSAGQLKTCKLCKSEKPLDDFHRCKHTRDGRNSYCKPCANDKARKNHLDNRDVRLKRFKKDYQANKEIRDAQSKKWAKDNPEKRKEMQRNYYQRNAVKLRAKHRQRYYDSPASFKAWQVNNIEKVREMKAAWRQKRGAEYSKDLRNKLRNATPAWADMDAMNAIYKQAREMNGDYQVDHIIPIQGKNVCGLHCEDNLQVLEARKNRLKSNKLMI